MFWVNRLADGIALPVFGPSGMENWGLIKYRETNLLLMEGETSSSSKESIAKLVAHEVGHQVKFLYLNKILLEKQGRGLLFWEKVIK